MWKPAKNTICIWFNRDAEEAAQFSLDDVKKMIEAEIPGAFAKKGKAAKEKTPAKKKAAVKKATPKKKK